MPPVRSRAAAPKAEPYPLEEEPVLAGETSHLLEALSRDARKMYHKMTSAQEPGYVYTQTELTGLVGIDDPLKLMGLIQEIMNMGLVKMLKQGDDLCYQAIHKSEAEKIQSMGKDEAMVYSYIEASGAEGIWTKTIKAKTNLHQTVVQRCLKMLEGKRYIKSVKSVKNPTRKIYMLASIQPSAEVTGGPWFTDNQLDTEFISSLLTIIFRYIASESSPSADEQDEVLRRQQDALKKARKSQAKKAGKKKHKAEEAPVVGPVVDKVRPEDVVYDQVSFTTAYKTYPTLDNVQEFVQTSGITTVDLARADIKALCDVLVYDGKVESLDEGFSFRAIKSAVDDAETASTVADTAAVIQPGGLSEAACGSCPVFKLCKPQGPVNAEECVYLEQWLAQ
ncbi:RNA polymerase Rpc34 [Dipodascopsis tothii]|uniref:RNA polymerase Rpc34 n=1 Tax=Dipodascopsis tothii TaxID=44089 RepID=UPI0034CDBB7E